MLVPSGKGKGAAKGAAAAAPPAGRADLKTELATLASTVFESALDLNIPRNQLTQSIQQLVSTRDKVLASYGIKVAATPVFAGVTAPGQAGKVGQVSGDIDWVSKLWQHTSKMRKMPMQKGAFTFEVCGEQGAYTATVTSEFLQTQYSGNQCPSKKAAESSAAQAAVTAEYPELAAALMSNTVIAAPQGQKRGVGQVGGAAPQMPIDKKSELMQGIQKLLGCPTTKEDVIYETQTVEGGYASTVRMPSYDSEAVYQGEVSDSKKSAECSAAEAAVTALADAIAVAAEETKRRKYEKNKGWFEAQKAKNEASGLEF